jgi:hypothetical protein
MLPADGTGRDESVPVGVAHRLRPVAGADLGHLPGPAPPGARTARGGTHHAPFGQIKKREGGAGRFALAADRPAACLQGIEQHARLGGAHGKLRDADREAG